MDKLENYRNLIQKVLREYAALTDSSKGSTQTATVFDTRGDRYLLLTYGRRENKKMNSLLLGSHRDSQRQILDSFRRHGRRRGDRTTQK